MPAEKINIYPRNKEKVIKLVVFYKQLLRICRVNPLTYGSLIHFFYTKNRKAIVHDIDALLPEKDFKRVIEILEKNNIRYNHNEKWHVLQIFDKRLKIEFDSKDFWQKNLPNDYKEFEFHGMKFKTISLNGLKKIYLRASKESGDNPHGNKKKFLALSKVKN